MNVPFKLFGYKLSDNSFLNKFVEVKGRPMDLLASQTPALFLIEISTKIIGSDIRDVLLMKTNQKNQKSGPYNNKKLQRDSIFISISIPI